MKKVSRELPKMEAGIAKPEMTVGLDLGDRYSHYCLLNSDGEVIEESRKGAYKAPRLRCGGISRAKIACASPWSVAPTLPGSAVC